jgi:hypothetical protein
MQMNAHLLLHEFYIGGRRIPGPPRLFLFWGCGGVLGSGGGPELPQTSSTHLGLVGWITRVRAKTGVSEKVGLKAEG